MKVRTATIHDGTIVKSHPMFSGRGCSRHRRCGCFYTVRHRFDRHLSALRRAGKYEEADRKEGKFSTLIAHEYAFATVY